MVSIVDKYGCVIISSTNTNVTSVMKEALTACAETGSITAKVQESK